MAVYWIKLDAVIARKVLSMNRGCHIVGIYAQMLELKAIANDCGPGVHELTAIFDGVKSSFKSLELILRSLSSVFYLKGASSCIKKIEYREPKKLLDALKRIQHGRTRIVESSRKLSIASVAEEAGMSRATIHNRYPRVAEEIRTALGQGHREKIVKGLEAQRDARYNQGAPYRN